MDQKPGYKTTEFWLSTLTVVAAAAAAALNSVQDFGIGQGWMHGALVGLSILSGALTTLGYSKGRVATKIAAINADK